MVMRIRVLRPSELQASDIVGWSDLRRRAGLTSPFFSPDWVRECARVNGPDRRLARVAVLEQDNEVVGFMPARVSRFAAQPVGAPMCDYQGVAVAPETVFRPRDVVRALGVGRLDFDTQIASQPAMAGFLKGRKVSYVMDLAEGYEGYVAHRRREGSDVLKDCAKKRRKLEREHGEVVFTADAHSDADFATLIAWKRARYGASRQIDIFHAGWPLELLENLYHRPLGEISGKLFTLHVGGRLAAAHYALSDGHALHAWFIGHDLELSRYSPGVMLMTDIVKWAAEQGLAEFDLGTGDYRFKQSLASSQREVAYGFVGRPSAAAAVRSLAYSVRGTAEALPLGRASKWPGKVMRRIDLLRGLKGSWSFAR
jgi:CelD/BcsL family acetyltransferase involved in cellulose biosynthesis